MIKRSPRSLESLSPRGLGAPSALRPGTRLRPLWLQGLRPPPRLFSWADSKSHNVLGIAIGLTIIDRQLPFEYTIASRSIDVMGMTLPVQNINHSAFRSMFEREKLSSSNFNDWFRSLKLVLKVEKKMFVIEQPIPPAPATDSTAQVLADWNAVYDAHNEVACLMLGRVKRFDLIQTFHACKQEERKPVGFYVLKIKGYVEQLEHLGYVLPQDLSVSLILNDLTSDFANFVRNYNIHNMGKTIGELHALLIEYEKGLPKKAATPQVMAIQGGGIHNSNKKSRNAKGKGKGKGKGKDKSYIPKPKNHKPFAKENPTKDDTCHHCKEGLKGERKLKQGALNLYVGNGIRAQVEAIGNFDLVLPNGLVNCLDNCSYAPTVTRGVVSFSRLVDNGFIQCFIEYSISVSKNDVLYFNVIPRDGIYEIDMLNLVPNFNSIYNVSNKRVKHNLDSTYLWYCRLAHISKKHIKKLQHDGLLKSTDDESFYQYVFYLSGKMTRKPFPHHTKREIDLLGLIHTDVCGPLRHVSRQGASYFLTFMDDYSHYGYVYLLKHKHEVFETFKVFKNEVENQLEKTIKALRSDRGGEYIKSAIHILNMVLTKKVDKTPYELWYVKVPNLSYLKVWGYEALVKRDTPDKLQQIYVKCIFVGYLKETIDVSGRAKELKEIQDEDTSPSENTSKTPTEVEEVGEHSLEDLKEPTNYKASMLDLESNKWLDAMNAEMQSMKDNQVWHLVDLPPNAIRILIAIAAFYNYEIWQIDVKFVFLNGYLDEDIYMVQPKGFVDPKYPRKVCKLQISIYGLKQASRSWNKRFDEEIKMFGFSQNLDEPCVYQKASRSNVQFLILYVDDIIIMGNHIPMLQSVKSYLGKCFTMKDLGEAAFILGIKIYRDRTKRLIGLSQSAYMDKILKRFKMDNSKRNNIPMQERFDLNKTQGASTPEEVKRMQNVPYASAVGSIMYAFLRNTKDMFLVYGGNPEAKLRVDCYYDAGFETDRDDIKSQTRYVFILNRGAVDWKSSKQSTTAMSATEAEYIATSEAAMEVVWIRKFILGLGIVPTINEPIKMFCHNSATLLIANELGVQRAQDTTIEDNIMFANVLNWAELIFLKFTQITI
ncbi:retrotransposon protein, putative, ty1-copia subclass [Tanacetum coccineum]